jgi:hypothetical protein
MKKLFYSQEDDDDEVVLVTPLWANSPPTRRRRRFTMLIANGPTMIKAEFEKLNILFLQLHTYYLAITNCIFELLSRYFHQSWSWPISKLLYVTEF